MFCKATKGSTLRRWQRENMRAEPSPNPPGTCWIQVEPRGFTDFLKLLDVAGIKKWYFILASHPLYILNLILISQKWRICCASIHLHPHFPITFPAFSEHLGNYEDIQNFRFQRIQQGPSCHGLFPQNFFGRVWLGRLLRGTVGLKIPKNSNPSNPTRSRWQYAQVVGSWLLGHLGHIPPRK